MRKELLSELNPWWDKTSYRFQVKDRTGYTSSFQVLNKTNSSTIDILIGPRRVGKTSLLRNIINKLLDKNVSANDILYFTSDNILANEYTIEDIIRAFISDISSKKGNQKYILIDEVQDLKSWALTIKYFHDNFNIKFVLTGSSSLILNKDTSKLTGRFKLFEVLGLDFKEFLEFSNKKLYKTVEKIMGCLKNTYTVGVIQSMY